MNKTVLLTGGLGFIGSNIVRHLLRTTSYRIFILDRATYAGSVDNLPHTPSAKRRVRVILGDITSRNIVNSAVRGVTAVVHLAAATHSFRSLTRALPMIKTNVIGTTIILEAAEMYGIERCIIFSSSEVYGNKLSGIPMDEDHPTNPVTPYAASKLAADRIAVAFATSKRLPVVVLRPFNAYGPYQHPEKMIPKFVTLLLRNQPISINHGGRQVRDWVYVEDHARAVAMMLSAPIEKIKGQVFNVGTGKATSVRQVAELLLQIVSKDTSYLRINDQAQPETMGNVGMSQKIAKIIGWKPSVELVDGLSRTVAWYRRNRNWWERKV